MSGRGGNGVDAAGGGGRQHRLAGAGPVQLRDRGAEGRRPNPGRCPCPQLLTVVGIRSLDLGQVGMIDQVANTSDAVAPLLVAQTPELVLLRHGETQWNRARRYQGQQDSPLSLTGVGQIRAVAHTLRPHIGDPARYQLWSSPLTRTRQSVSILCEALSLSYDDVRFDDRLMERSYGRWEGLTLDEISARYPEDVAREQEDRWNFSIPAGGESFADVAKRLRVWLSELPAIQPVIVMVHGGSGRVLRGLCEGLSPDGIFACNDLQSTTFLISNGTSTTLLAETKHLRQFGCTGAGLGVKI